MKAVEAYFGVNFHDKQAAGSTVHKQLERNIASYKPVAGIEIIPEVFFHPDGTQTNKRELDTLGIDLLIRHKGTDVLLIDLKLGAGFPAGKRIEISKRAGNLDVVQVFIGIK